MMQLMSTSIVIPAYNEEKIIKKAIIQVYRNFSKSEIIVVDDGSTDNTAKVARSLQNKIPNLKVIRLSLKCGKGASILKGFKIARGKIIGFLDADDAFEIKDIKKMVGLLKSKRCDCVIASKWKGVKFSQVNETFFKKISSRVFNMLVTFLFQLKFEDTQGGSKFLKRKVLMNVGTDFCCKGFEMDVELLVKALKTGCIIKEIFIPSTCRRESKFKMLSAIPMFLGIIKLRMRGIQ